jgi:membrane associated rhomboid family serine protease
MIPLKIDEPMQRIPIVTMAIIIICSVIHFQRSVIFSSPGLVPLDIIHSILNPGKELPATLITLITAFFIHGSLLHLAGNLWYLWLFGSALENQLPSGKFLLLYLSFGILAMIVQIVENPISSIPIVGASGAIAGVMGMYLILRPFSKIVLWLPPIFFFRLPSSLFLLFWFWLQWRNSIAPDRHGTLIAWWAHIGGFIGGVIGAIYIRFSGKLPLTTSRRKKKRRPGN